MRQLFLLLYLYSCFVFSAQSELCSKEQAYLDEIALQHVGDTLHDCSISYEQFERLVNPLGILVDMPDVIVHGMVNINESELAGIVSLKNSQPVLITSGLNSAEIETYYCSKLFKLNSNVRILTGGVQALPVLVQPYVSLTVAAMALASNKAVLYSGELAVMLPIIVSLDYRKDFNLNKLKNNYLQKKVFFTKASEGELKRYAELFRQTTNSKKTIPARYTCK